MQDLGNFTCNSSNYVYTDKEHSCANCVWAEEVFQVFVVLGVMLFWSFVFFSDITALDVHRKLSVCLLSQL